MQKKIPKVIHYCWFGGNELPELALKCIESWKRYCPDYEIIEWNESNFDINCCAYAREAYEAKKWAFVSDYARLKILHEHGGVYFDTDVELVKSIEDIIYKGGFMGVENDEFDVNPGLGVGVYPRHALIYEMLMGYHERHFVNEDGTYDLKTIVYYTTEILKKRGLVKKNEIQMIDDVNVYPKDYFCPLDYETGQMKKTGNTVSIHHFIASWCSERMGYTRKLRYKLNRFLPKKLANALAFRISIVKHNGWSGYIHFVTEKLKKSKR